MEPQLTWTIQIPSRFSEAQRLRLANLIINEIISRTKQGIDKNGRAFAKYSDSYKESKDFALAGKSQFRVNLTLTGEMLRNIEVISHGAGFITIGFPENSDENDKARWALADDNGPVRDFFGLPQSAVSEFIKRIEAEEPRQIRFADQVVLQQQREEIKQQTEREADSILRRVFSFGNSNQ